MISDVIGCIYNQRRETEKWISKRFRREPPQRVDSAAWASFYFF